MTYIQTRKQRYQNDLETEVSYSAITKIRGGIEELRQLERVVQREIGTLNRAKFDLIDRTVIKEEIESLKVNFTGLQNVSMGVADALDEQRKSILTLLDEQMTWAISEETSDWIPVETELPEEYDRMFEKTSDEVCVTVQYNDGTKKSTTSYLIDSEWQIEKKLRRYRPKVIA